MGRITILLAILVLLVSISFIQPKVIFASTSAPSANLAQEDLPQSKGVDPRGKILKAYLQSYKSPLADNGEDFIHEADVNNLDWKLVVSISGVESYFGEQIPPDSYNGWGFGVYRNTVRRFGSWQEGISTVSNAIRYEYMNKRGAQNIYEIGSTYAADPFWADKVTHFMDDLDSFAKEYSDSTLSISL